MMSGPVCHELGRCGRGIRFFLTKVADTTTYRATDAPGLYILAIVRTLTIPIRRTNQWQRRKRPRRRDSSRSIPGFLLSPGPPPQGGPFFASPAARFAKAFPLTADPNRNRHIGSRVLDRKTLLFRDKENHDGVQDQTEEEEMNGSCLTRVFAGLAITRRALFISATRTRKVEPRRAASGGSARLHEIVATARGYVNFTCTSSRSVAATSNSAWGRRPMKPATKLAGIWAMRML